SAGPASRGRGGRSLRPARRGGVPVGRRWCLPMGRTIAALTRAGVFPPKAAKICCRISQRIRAVSTRFMAQDLETRGGGDTHVGRRPRNRLQELAAFAVLCRSAYPAVEF